MKFELISNYQPSGDQPQAIEKLTNGLVRGVKNQVLLGVTGSGKTFTIANIVRNTQLPTLVISHNKTLAAQLFQEFKEYFPKNAVEYFVSYYDYYQPESYLPATDTYIEKDSDINEEIDRFRLMATNSLLTRNDVLVVSSVSCIYNLGSPVEYAKTNLEVRVGMKITTEAIMARLTQILYERNDFDFKRSSFRVRGESVDVYPSYSESAIHFDIEQNILKFVEVFNPITGEAIKRNEGVTVIYPAKHYVAPEHIRTEAIDRIKEDLAKQLDILKKEGKTLEAYRLEQRTRYDLELIGEIGYCKGIENYSIYFDGRKIGDPPYSLIDYYNMRFGDNWLLVIDESHITVPQVRGMYNGDRSRKETLVHFGFRLPTALDNRPLKFDEFVRKVHHTVFASATPAEYELSLSQKENITEQLIRPTGLIDPVIEILPAKNQVNDLVLKIEQRVKAKERVLVTTLTKRMAEELSEFLVEKGLKVAYLHSDIKTLERTNILDDLRKGNFDVLVGINLLREGLDLPEVSLVAILDADKEGFLRSETSLIQTMGRAARHINGRVILYADSITKSIENAVKEVERRRKIQEEYNVENNITPVSIQKALRHSLYEDPVEEKETKDLFVEDYEFRLLKPKERQKVIKNLETKMKQLASMLEFEKAAEVRDRVRELRGQ